MSCTDKIHILRPNAKNVIFQKKTTKRVNSSESPYRKFDTKITLCLLYMEGREKNLYHVRVRESKKIDKKPLLFKNNCFNL